MKKETVSCIFCKEKRLYQVSPTQFKCFTCKKKFSLQKYQHEQAIIQAFIANQSASLCASSLGLNYATVKKMYQKIRLLLMEYSENIYHQQTHTFSQYDEYYFLPTCKRKNPHYLFDAIGILGMVYETHIYTLLLPNQFAHLKHLEEKAIEKEMYARFLMQHRVAHYESFENPLSNFWRYLERWMEHFKGVKEENFIAYLKEAEFKFNHKNEVEQRSILEALWRKAFYM